MKSSGHRERQVRQRTDALVWDEQGLVFPNELGRALSPQNLVQRYFHPALARAGLPKIRFHDLRHTAATLLLEAGVHPKIVSEMLGHADVGITLNLYSHVTPTMQAAAVQALDATLNPAQLSSGLSSNEEPET